MPEYAAQIEASRHTHAMLVAAQHEVPEESTSLFWSLCYWPAQLAAEMSEVRTRLVRFHSR